MAVLVAADLGLDETLPPAELVPLAAEATGLLTLALALTPILTRT